MSEAAYDAEIAPALLALAKRCNELGMPFVATVEYEPNCWGTTADAPKERSAPIDWAYVAARSNGNADIMIGHLVRRAREVGHNSAYLMQLGIPMTPQEQQV